MKKIQYTPHIWTIDNFLSGEECQNLIIFSENKSYDEATVSLRSGAKMMKNIRNNERLIYEDEKLAKTYWQKLEEYCPQFINEIVKEDITKSEVIGLNPRFRFYKYESNQRFKKHIDGRVKLEKEGKVQESRITFMIYLSDDFEGGQTVFDYKNEKNELQIIEIQPKTGTALCFVHEIKHEGKPVPKGTKYVLRSDIMFEKVADTF
ncbi:2OG-Fe(II) oxygenase [Bernardetia sp. OM2101]|uniref:2OG-Fe(II) oxygenase n=1 Tax=Bernardetia sp. OM2101 TaxID=3344876 RepID=UPI0035CF7B27